MTVPSASSVTGGAVTGGEERRCGQPNHIGHPIRPRRGLQLITRIFSRRSWKQIEPGERRPMARAADATWHIALCGIIAIDKEVGRASRVAHARLPGPRD
jgi:hypothetical protein